MDTNSSMEVMNLASITGITAASMFIVQIIKRLTPVDSALAKVPVFIYAILSSIVLAFVANRVLKLEDGSPYLEGSTLKVIWAAIVSAAGSSGFFTWLYNRETVKEVKLDPTNQDFGGKTPSNKLMLLLPLLLILGCGCVNYEKAILREGMDGYLQTMKNDHKQWAEALAIDPATGKDNRHLLPSLTPNQKKQIDAIHEEYQQLVDEDREADKKLLRGT